MSTAIKLKSKYELAANLADVLHSLEPDKKRTERLKKYLKEYKVSPGEVQKIINNSDEEMKKILDSEDDKFLCLLTEAVNATTGDARAVTSHYFTSREIKEVRSTYEKEIKEKLSFPLTLHNVTRVSDDDYILTMKASEIKEWSGVFQYNYETQREARLKTDKLSGEIIPQPKTNPKSVKEIVELIKKGKAIRSMLTFNARLGTSDSGEELIYDKRESTLTITEGTLLDILDGFHRLTAIIIALTEDPSIDMTFKINIVNFSIKQAQEFFAQLNTTNPIAKSRMNEVAENRLGDFIAKQIQANSELGEYITKSDHVNKDQNLLVTFKALSDSIDEIFNVEDKPSANTIAKYLSKFFNHLMFNNSEAFMTNIAEVRKDSVINANRMFYGYITLAKKFYENNIDLEKLQEVIESINFNRDNPLWAEIGLVDSKTKRIERSYGVNKPIINYFSNII
jgi:hypothetical protein